MNVKNYKINNQIIIYKTNIINCFYLLEENDKYISLKFNKHTQFCFFDLMSLTF